MGEKEEVSLVNLVRPRNIKLGSGDTVWGREINLLDNNNTNNNTTFL